MGGFGTDCLLLLEQTHLTDSLKSRVWTGTPPCLLLLLAWAGSGQRRGGYKELIAAMFVI